MKILIEALNVESKVKWAVMLHEESGEYWLVNLNPGYEDYSTQDNGTAKEMLTNFARHIGENPIFLF